MIADHTAPAAHAHAPARIPVWAVPGTLALVFLAGFLGVGSLIYRATGDASFGIEPDYYAKSLQWDQTRRDKAAAEALGWTADAVLDASELRVTLCDRAASPLVGATVTAEIFAWNRSKDRRTLTLTEQSPGVYTASVEGADAGRWQVRLRAARAADVFLHECALHAEAAPHALPGAHP